MCQLWKDKHVTRVRISQGGGSKGGESGIRLACQWVWVTTPGPNASQKWGPILIWPWNAHTEMHENKCWKLIRWTTLAAVKWDMADLRDDNMGHRDAQLIDSLLNHSVLKLEFFSEHDSWNLFGQCQFTDSSFTGFLSVFLYPCLTLSLVNTLSTL